MAPWAVGMSVQTKSTTPDSRAISMAGADSWAGWMSAPSIWGRQVSYQMVPIWLVQVPDRSLMPAAEARAPSALVRQTMEAYR